MIGRMPERPLDTAPQNDRTPQPRAEIAPIPVIATLAAGKQLLHACHYVSNRPQRFRRFIGNVDVELIFNRKDNFIPSSESIFSSSKLLSGLTVSTGMR